MRFHARLLPVAGAACLLAQAAFAQFLYTLPTITTLASTVPANGDQNPYGVAVVPVTQGMLTAGNVLVSNFNNAANQQGTGTTIVQITPGGTQTLFAQINPMLPGCPGGVGLTTALMALRSGFVIVGSTPTTDGTSATLGPGCLIILNSSGAVVGTISGNGINGPWDMSALDMGTGAVLFVSNVLNGTVAGNGRQVNMGTVLRIVLSIPMGGIPMPTSFQVVASGLGEKTDPNALVIGPTGSALGADGSTLYVSDTLNNRIVAIPNAVTRTTDFGPSLIVAIDRNLNQPLGMTLAPNGNILTVNNGDGFMVETMPDGRQVATRYVDVSMTDFGAGTLFGLALRPGGTGVYFVDDGNNTLNLLH